jgi:hypothetical protein
MTFNPHSVLSRPMQFQSSPAQGVVPVGFAGIPARVSSDPTSGIGLEKPAFLDAGTTFADKNTNGSYKHAFFLDKLHGWQPHHTGGKLPLMISTKTSTSQRDRAVTHQMHSVPHMNYLLRKDAEFRNRYSKPDVLDFMNDWKFAGFQQGEDMTRANKYESTKQNIYVLKRVRTDNVWVAAGHSARATCEQDSLYFMLRRYKDEVHSDQFISDYYWQLDPFYGPGKLHRPPVFLYSNTSAPDIKDKWIGDVIRVGTVHYNYSSHMWDDTTVADAQQGLYPVRDDAAYKTFVYALPQVDIDLMV